MKLVSELESYRFFRHFLIKSLACFGFSSGIIQLLIVFLPNLESSFQGVGPIVTTITFCLIVGAATSWPREPQMDYNSPKTKIVITKGDLLEEKGHIAVGTCDTFDTLTPTIISKNSLLGQTIEKLFGSDVSRLNKLLTSELREIPVVGRVQKPGKTNRYPLGTIAAVRHDPRIIFFMAYCEMSETNEAHGTIESVWTSLNNLWASLSARGNHGSISMPVIGGGTARMSNLLPAQDAIRLIILSFMFASRNGKVSDELRIVVPPKDYDRLDRLELQSFLSSLRTS